MNRSLLVLYRATLRVYPRAFRREYEDALVQVVLDQCTFGGRTLRWVVLRELPDVAASALRMRGRSLMTRFAVALFGLVAAVLAVLVAGPIWIAPVAVVVVAVVVSMRSAPPVERGVTGRHPWRWLAASAGAIAASIGLPAAKGSELSEPAWAAMAAFLVLGVALGVTGVSQLLLPSRTSPPGAR